MTQGENLENNIEVTKQNEIVDQVPNETLINSSSGEQSILIKCYDPWQWKKKWYYEIS